jgi:hypothetical protein
MDSAQHIQGQIFRVWLARYYDWEPCEWYEVPQDATALEPVDGCMTADEAALFLQGFNQAMLRQPRQIWAVAIPVSVRYDGDLEPGMIVDGHALALQNSCC